MSTRASGTSCRGTRADWRASKGTAPSARPSTPTAGSPARVAPSPLPRPRPRPRPLSRPIAQHCRPQPRPQPSSQPSARPRRRRPHRQPSSRLQCQRRRLPGPRLQARALRRRCRPPGALTSTTTRRLSTYSPPPSASRRCDLDSATLSPRGTPTAGSPAQAAPSPPLHRRSRHPHRRRPLTSAGHARAPGTASTRPPRTPAAGTLSSTSVSMGASRLHMRVLSCTRRLQAIAGTTLNRQLTRQAGCRPSCRQRCLPRLPRPPQPAINAKTTHVWSSALRTPMLNATPAA